MEKKERKRKPKKTYICIYCNKQLSQSSNLKSHLTIHTGQKDFSCSYCQKKFAWKQSLNNHEKIHTGQKGYDCTVCEYKTTTKGNLNNHIRAHLKEKPYKCQEPNCGQRFGQSSSLKSHQLVHNKHDNSLFKFSCPICPCKFALKIWLNRHVKTHEDSIEFKTKGEDDVQQQVSGIKSKGRQRFFNCDHPDCNYTSTTKGLLTKHLKTHSQENLSM